MIPLSPFQLHDEPLGLSAKIELIEGSGLYLEFALTDPLHLVLDSLVPGTHREPFRAHGLWNTTCFEAFWGIPGSPAYWELNLSGTQPKWNLYKFQSYRQPGSPEENFDFSVRSWSVTATSLRCELVTPHLPATLEASLCAVVRTAHATHYYATKHAGTEADFHRRESFTIQLLTPA